MGWLGTNQIEAIESGLVCSGWFAKLDFTSGAMRLCTLVGDVRYDGHLWRGVGQITDMSTMKQLINGAASRATIGLAGVSEEAATKSLSEIEEVTGRDITIYLGLLSSQYKVIGSLRPVWIGTMETVRPVIAGSGEGGDGGQSSTIAVECATVFSVRRRVRGSLYSDRQQRQISSTDQFCSRTDLYRFGQKQFPY